MLKFMVLILTVLVSLGYSEIQVRGGELASNDQLLYGRFEMRMRTAQGNGILSTFFTYENDSWMPNSNNPWREIDIEVLGRYTDRFQANIITGINENKTTSESFPILSSNPADAYHTYAVEWTPDYIAFLFDGVELRRTKAGDGKNQVEDCRGIPQSYRFNMWANEETAWVGKFSADILPKFQFVNWMKYYSYSEQTKEFTLEWTDNFDKLDTKRWYKGTHTILEFTQFDKGNVIVKDGTLILAITDMQGTGLDNIEVPKDETSIIKKSFAPVKKSSLNVTVKNKHVLCSVHSQTDGKQIFTLSDFNGRTICNKTYNLGTGYHSIPLVNGIAPGVYLLHSIIDQTRNVQTVSIP
ncbi:MAG: family 16 glycosylhydrolase [Fibrobacter sp.]|nr:family 16 glycosylhydrolase [Fibrobacter sp.]